MVVDIGQILCSGEWVSQGIITQIPQLSLQKAMIYHAGLKYVIGLVASIVICPVPYFFCCKTGPLGRCHVIQDPV